MSTLRDILIGASKQEGIVQIYIGKNLNPKCFLLNNKIFFDILLSYFPKNGWTLQNQYLESRTQWSASRSIVSRVERKESEVMGFISPVTQMTHFEERSDIGIHKYIGSYMDITLHKYRPNIVPYRLTEISDKTEKELEWIQDYNSNIDRMFSTLVEEVSVYTKPTCPVKVFMNVVRGGEQRGEHTDKEKVMDTSYSVSLYVDRSLVGYNEEVDNLVEVIEMAMSRYKKTDRGGFQIFKQIS